MPVSYEEMILIKNISTTDEDGDNVELKTGTVLCFRHISCENTEDENWHFSLANDYYGPRFIVPSNLAKQYIKNHLQYYAEQFSQLDQEVSYFGQVKNGSFFSIKNGNTKSTYIKIGEYLAKNGVKYNAAKVLNNKDFSWQPDVEESYQDLEFVYIELDQPIVENLHNVEKAKFIPPQPMKVCELTVEFPKMLEVIDSFMHHQELSIELREIYRKYNNQKLAAFSDYQEYNNIYITNVVKIIEKIKVEMEEAVIMRQIEKEVSVLREKLIAERLGKVHINILPDGFCEQPAL